VAEYLLIDATRYRSWVELPFISDHAPIVLQLDYGYNLVAYPFKFNPSFLLEDSFCDLVQNYWGTQQDVVGDGAQHRLSTKLFGLKAEVKKWLATKKKKELALYIHLEEEIAKLTEQFLQSDLDHDLRTRLKELEAERNKLLLDEEGRWWLKSRAIWIKCGDKNTIFFHLFASYMRNKKHLWEIKDGMGQELYGQDALKTEAQHYFITFYQEPKINTMMDRNQVPSNWVCTTSILHQRQAHSKEVMRSSRK
jgi:hypothetical protein